MRLRNVPGARQEMLVNPYVIQEPERFKGVWCREVFHNDHPLHIEIGTGKGQFLMAQAALHSEINYIGIEKYSAVHYGATADATVDRNHAAGRGGAIPALGDIRNCHINIGTGRELTIRELSQLVATATGFTGVIDFDATKPDGTPRKLIDVSKLHRLGWTHKVELEEGVSRLYQWYLTSL